MRGILFLTITVILFSGQLFGQDESKGCPPISVTGPLGNVEPGATIQFAVNADIFNYGEFEFDWQISGGTLETERNKPFITVGTTAADDGTTIKATVMVKGLHAQCNNTAKYEAVVAFPVGSPLVLDEFGAISKKDMKARLEQLRVEMQKRPDYTLYVIFNIDKKNPDPKAARIYDFIKFYLGKEKKPNDMKRVVFSSFDNRTINTRFYLVPPPRSVVLDF